MIFSLILILLTFFAHLNISVFLIKTLFLQNFSFEKKRVSFTKILTRSVPTTMLCSSKRYIIRLKKIVYNLNWYNFVKREKIILRSTQSFTLKKLEASILNSLFFFDDLFYITQRIFLSWKL